MRKKNPPPAYIEYAANNMADRKYRLMSLAERGLLTSIKNECWVNHSVPIKPELLAKVLGLDIKELGGALTENVKAFLEAEGEDYVVPQLINYRAELDARAEAQSKGGKKGSAITNESKRKKYQNVSSTLTTNSASNFTSNSSRSGRVLNIGQINIEQDIKNQSLEKVTIPLSNNDRWVSDYEAASKGS